MIKDWNQELLPYKQAVNELKIKLRGIREQFQNQKERAPIEFVTRRVKPVDSNQKTNGSKDSGGARLHTQREA